ncbi:MAG: hypothetical protein AB1461_09250 [Thermodesulfobacteriota bacterium]
MTFSLETLYKLENASKIITIVSAILALISGVTTYLVNKEINRLTSPRTLTENQKQYLIKYFHQNDKVKLKLYSINSAQETLEFAKQIGDIFIESKWEVEPQIDQIQPIGGQYINLIIESPVYLLSSARVIKNAFASINIQTNIETTNSNNEYLKLIVGLKEIN